MRSETLPRPVSLDGVADKLLIAMRTNVVSSSSD